MSDILFGVNEALAKLGAPPSVRTLRDSREPKHLRVIPRGHRLWHIYKRGGPHPTTWDSFRTYGPVDARFDHHTRPTRVQSRGILYTATLIATCVAEFFQATRIVDLTRDEPWLAAHRAARDLCLLDLTSSWPTRAGSSTLLNNGPREYSRHWSAAIYAAYPDIDGLYYASSMYRLKPCIALYERAIDSVPPYPESDRPLVHHRVYPRLAWIALDIGYDFN